MAATEDRLFQLLDQEVERKHTGWALHTTNGAEILSPVEPCHGCDTPVFLVNYRGNRMWLELGDVEDTDTLFPQCRTKRHHCQDGDLVGVEAALILADATNIDAPVAAALGCGEQHG